MTAPISQAYQRFEDYKENPMVAALRSFITLRLERPLESVASWGVEVTDKPQRTFHLRFLDGTVVRGTLEEVWQVRVGTAGREE